MNVTHEVARVIVELYLEAKGRKVHPNNLFQYPAEFVQRHRLKKFPGHSYDILTDKEIIEIDDYQKHMTKNQIINDNIAQDYAKKHLSAYRFYRLKKEEIVNQRGHCQPTAKDYLRSHLF